VFCSRQLARQGLVLVRVLCFWAALDKEKKCLYKSEVKVPFGQQLAFDWRPNRKRAKEKPEGKEKFFLIQFQEIHTCSFRRSARAKLEKIEEKSFWPIQYQSISAIQKEEKLDSRATGSEKKRRKGA